jgi:hypothetical protein
MIAAAPAIGGTVGSCAPIRRRTRSSSRRAPTVIAAAAAEPSSSSTPSSLPQRAAGLAAAVALTLAPAAHARPEGVSRPDLLPKEPNVTVIDVAGYLAPSEEQRIKQTIDRLEKDTGFRLRVLAQAYPETPGLAVRDYWSVDDQTVVFVADEGFGDLLNFNVGQAVDLEVPRNFWNRLAAKFGNRFFVRDKGEAVAITDTVAAIDACLREPQGRTKCSGIVDVSDVGL